MSLQNLKFTGYLIHDPNLKPEGVYGVLIAASVEQFTTTPHQLAVRLGNWTSLPALKSHIWSVLRSATTHFRPDRQRERRSGDQFRAECSTDQIWLFSAGSEVHCLTVLPVDAVLVVNCSTNAAINSAINRPLVLG